MKRAAERLGLLGPARAIKARLGSEETRRDLRDQRNLRRLLSSVLTSSSNCVDVGAHRGEVLAQFVRLAPDGRHVAYEPIPALAQDLHGRFPEVDVRQVALSNRRSVQEFQHVRDRPALSGFRRRPDLARPRIETISVTVEDLDSSLPPDYVPSLIKIDVEGAEQQVIEGGLRTIAAHRPLVVFEHGSGAAPAYGTHPDDVFRLLVVQGGLRIFDLAGNGPYTPKDFIRAFEAGEHWNFVARP